MRNVAISLAVFMAGCAGPATDFAFRTEEVREAPSAHPNGVLNITLANVLGENLTGRVDLFDVDGNPPVVLEVPDGAREEPAPIGDYRAYVHIYEDGVPILVEVVDLTVAQNRKSELEVNLLEGAAGALRLRDFDGDGDLAIDRVELAAGTDPADAGDVPGRAPLPLDMRVLAPEAKWYCGELHAHTRFGRGSETVAAIVKRAERAGLDFLAITDRNTLAATSDPAFHSNKVVLIPAMEWGDDRGVALIYGPRTAPDPPSTMAAAQAECIRVQAQGGIFAVAHPCFPSEFWQWGLSYVNAIEVWCRDWRSVPPLLLDQLGEDLKVKAPGEGGGLMYSLAAAAAQSNLVSVSANAQSTFFWDCELARGLMAAAIGGSNSANPKVPLGRPITYVYARDKSMPAIIEGIRMGRTVVSSGKKGPMLYMNADVLNDNKIDVGIGGVVPLGVDVMFHVGVERAAGKKLQVLENGRPIRTVPIVKDFVLIRFLRHPTLYSTYRARVITTPAEGSVGFGDLEVHAMTSPIYAQDITQELLWRNPKLDVDRTWIEIQSSSAPELDLPEE